MTGFDAAILIGIYLLTLVGGFSIMAYCLDKVWDKKLNIAVAILAVCLVIMIAVYIKL